MGSYTPTTSSGGTGPAAPSNPFSNSAPASDFQVITAPGQRLPQGADTGDLVPGRMHTSPPVTGSAVSMLGDLSSMGVQDILALQDRMIQAGYLDKTDRSGIADASTRTGYTKLLEDTSRMNAQGMVVTPDDVLNRAQQATALTPGQGPQYQTALHVYTPTDPARIRLTAEAAFQAAIGKKGTKAQIDRFVTHFANAETAAQKTGFDAADVLTSQQVGGDMPGAFTPSGANPGISDKDWKLTQSIAGKFGVDPRLLVAIGQHETGWGTQGDGKKGNVLGVGSYDSGSTYKYAGLQNQLTEGAKLLSQHGVYTVKDVAQGKARFWATDPNWASGVLSAYSSLAGDTTSAANPRGMSIDGKQVGGEVGVRLQALIAAAPGKIGIASGTRSHAEQARLYADYQAGKGSLAAPPGHSKHEQGLAADLTFSSPAVRKWAHDHAAEYGLSFPIASESWHVEPTGTPGPAAGMPAISQAVTVPQPDLAAQATEYAQNADPTDTQAYGIGQQFDNLVSLLHQGVV